MTPCSKIKGVEVRRRRNTVHATCNIKAFQENWGGFFA
jgi:hypothetical protein